MNKRNQPKTAIRTAFGKPRTSVPTCPKCNKEVQGDACDEHPKAGTTFNTIIPMKGETIKFRVAPLSFDKVYPSTDLTAALDKSISEMDVLEFLCRDGLNKTVINGFVTRYRAITKKDTELTVAPDHALIQEKLIDPLLQAKTSYMIGNWLAVISLCGVICEVLSNLVYEINPLKFSAKELTEKQEIEMFGTAVIEMTQDRRTRLLKAAGIINDEVFQKFKDVRETRNKYIHMFKSNISGSKTDALRSYQSTVHLVSSVLNQKYDGKNYSITPALYSYITKKR